MNNKKGSQVVEFVIMAMLVLVIGFTGLTIFGDNIQAFFEGNATKSTQIANANSDFSNPVPQGYDSDTELARLLAEIQRIGASEPLNASSSLQLAQALLDYLNYLDRIGVYNSAFDCYRDMANKLLGLDISNMDAETLEAYLSSFADLFTNKEEGALSDLLIKSVSGLPEDSPERKMIESMISAGESINLTEEEIIDLIDAVKAREYLDAQKNMENLIKTHEDYLTQQGVDLNDYDAVLNALKEMQNNPPENYTPEQVAAILSTAQSLMDTMDSTGQDFEGLTPKEIIDEYLGDEPIPLEPDPIEREPIDPDSCPEGYTYTTNGCYPSSYNYEPEPEYPYETPDIKKPVTEI